MTTLKRPFHDNLTDSKYNYNIQNNLEQTTRFFINHYLIPALRQGDTTTQMQILRATFEDSVVKPHITVSYNIGARYVKNIANDSSPTFDNELISSYSNKYTNEFFRTISSICNISRLVETEGHQILAQEKERVSSEFASNVAWSTFNNAIKEKAKEYREALSSMNTNGILGIKRKIWNKDFTAIYKQRILTDRINGDREKTSQTVPVSMPRLERALRARGELRREIIFTLVTQKDERVCEFCAALETDFWNIDDPDIPDIPVHPNCRCRLALAENEFEQ